MYRNSAPWLGLIYICAVGFQLTVADLHAPFIKDQYLYFLKASEILHGNFSPALSHSIGWPVFAAPFLALVASATLEQRMLYAHIISAFTCALTVFPAYYLLRHFIESRRLAILGTAFIALNPIFVLFGAAFASESLFVPLGTLIFALLVRIPCRPWFLVGAMAFAGAAVAVRPNGIFFVPIGISAALLIYGYQYAVQKESGRWVVIRLGIIVLSLAAFAATAMPALVQRTQTFGSPFNFGAANKYFVTDYTKVWSDTDAGPSLAEYLTHTSPKDIARKFVVNGFGRIIATLILSDQEWSYGPFILPVLLPFFIIGVIYLRTNASAWILIIAMTIWIALLSFVYDAFGRDTRYLWVLIPVTSVFSVAGIERVYKALSNDGRRIFFPAIAAGSTLFLFWDPALIVADNARHPKNHATPAWALWAAAHLKGRIAIYEGGDSLMQLLPDASIAGESLFRTYAPVSGISVMRPGNLPGPEAACAYFHSRDVSYVVVGPGSEARPYLLELGNPKYRNCFEPVYTDGTISPTVVILKVLGMS